MTVGVTTGARNDNYGDNLTTRATYCLNSMIYGLDQVVYVDWNSVGETLIDLIRPNLLKTGKLICVYVSPEQHRQFVGDSPDNFCGALSRNVGLRRLTTDYLVASNIDVIAPRKSWIEAFNPDPGIFYTVSRLATGMYEFPHIPPTDPAALLDWVDASWRSKQGQPWSRAYDEDVYSLIGNCGDWQMAHRDIWYRIQGYDNNLIYRGYADGNVQVKAAKMGFSVRASWDFPVMHMHHAGATFAARHNTLEEAMKNVTGSRNDDSWGWPDLPFRTEII